MEIIDEILTACSSDSFWDAYDVEQIFERTEAGMQKSVMLTKH